MSTKPASSSSSKANRAKHPPPPSKASASSPPLSTSWKPSKRAWPSTATKNPASPPAPNPLRRKSRRNEPPQPRTNERKPASREYSRSPPPLPPPSARAPVSPCSARVPPQRSSHPRDARAATPPQTPPVPYSHAPPPPEPAKRSSLRHR